MVMDERTCLTEGTVADKTRRSNKKGSRCSAKYGSIGDRKTRAVDAVQDTKQKYRKLKFLKNLWRWKSSKKNREELLEEGPNVEQQNVTLVTYALCFIMMLAGLSVKMN